MTFGSTEVFGNYYVGIQWVEKQIPEGHDVLLELDWQGALQVHKHFPDAVLIFVAPPSLATLQERLHHQGNSVDDVALRTTGARHELMQEAEHYHYLVINADFDLTLAQLQSIVQAARLQMSGQSGRLSALLSG